MDKNEQDLLLELEKCNEEYLMEKRENTILKKRLFNAERVVSIVCHQFDFRKYRRKYGIKKPISNRNIVKNLDALTQEKSLHLEGEKTIAVYSCITGDYDKLTEPRYVHNKNIEYIMFTDQQISSENWKIRAIPEKLKTLSASQINRYIKLHPHEFFKEYDYSIYVDGNIEIISDLSGLVNLLTSSNGIAMHKHFSRSCLYQEAVACQVLKKGNKVQIDKQIRDYRSEGFPENYGLLECTIIVTDLMNSKARDIYDGWWCEMMNHPSGRDQLSLPYVLWKMDINPEDLGTLGSNLHLHPKFRIVQHL